jgi:hypothetical protein
MTLNQVIQRLSEIVGAHKQLRSFAYVRSAPEYIFKSMSDKKITYPICVVEHSTGQIQSTQHLSTHQLRLYVLDLVNRANETDTNEQDVLSDAFSIAEDLIALIRDPAYADTWFTVGDGSVTMIADYTQDYVGGVAFDLPLSTMFFGDRCAVPASELPAETVDIITTARDYVLIQFENTTDTNTFSLPSLVGKSILTLIRGDTPQVSVVGTPLPVADWDENTTSKQKIEFKFNSVAGSVLWGIGNNLFEHEVITIICK